MKYIGDGVWSMYKDGYLSYNPTATDEAITFSMKAGATDSIISNIDSVNVPSKFKSASQLETTLESIKTTLPNVSKLPVSLKEMKNVMESYIGNDNLAKLTSNMKGKEARGPWDRDCAPLSPHRNPTDTYLRRTALEREKAAPDSLSACPVP